MPQHVTRSDAIAIPHPYRTGLILTAGGLTAFTGWTLLGPLSSILWCIALAAFFAIGLSPAVALLTRRGMPRPLAITGVVAAVTLALAGVILMIVPAVVDQISQLLSRAEEFAASGALDALGADLQQFVPVELFDVRAALNAAMTGIASGATMQAVSSGVVGAGTAIGTAFFLTTIVVVLSVYFLASGRWLSAQLIATLPRRHRSTGLRIARRVSGTVSKYFVGQIFLAALNGVLSLIILLCTGSSLPMLFAATAFICALIPLIGIPLGAAIIVGAQTIIAPTGPIPLAVLTVWYLLYMFVEAYVIAPRVIGRTVGMREVVVVLVTLVAGSLYGTIGALLGVPAAIAAGAAIQVMRGSRNHPQAAREPCLVSAQHQPQ